MLKKPLLKNLKITSLTNPLMKWQANQVVGGIRRETKMSEEILVDRGTVDQFEILDRTLLIYNFVNLTTAGRAYMTCAIRY
jgi:hypothetical protein